MPITASALISTSFDSASVINVPPTSVCCAGQHTEWPVCLRSVIYFVIKRPGGTEWHQISLSTIQSRYIIQQRNNGCEHRRKSCRSLGMTLTCVHRKAQKHQMDVHRAADGGDAEACRWTHGGQLNRPNLLHTDDLTGFYCQDRELPFLILLGLNNTGPTKIRKQT